MIAPAEGAARRRSRFQRDPDEGLASMANSNRPPEKPQSLHDLRRQIREDAERWREHPLVREEAPKLRQLAEALRRPPPPQPSASPSKRKRRQGAGRKLALSSDTIMRLRRAYQNALRQNPKLAIPRLAYKFLRKLLPEAECSVSNRTLSRHIIKWTK